MQFKQMLKASLTPRNLFVSLVVVGIVAAALAVIPTKNASNTAATGTENCGSAPLQPTFTYWPYGYSSGTLECKNFPVIDAALDTPNPQFSNSEADWNDGLQMNVGQNGVARMYIHNGATDDPEVDPNTTVARDVKITTVTEQNVGTTHRITATFTSSNTASVTQSFVIKTPANAQLVLYPNSGFMFTHDGRLITTRQNLNLGNSTFNLGELDACWQYSLFLTFKFKVIQAQVDNSTLSITKQVRNITDNTNYQDSVNADHNDRVGYKIVVTNNGPGVAHNVTVTDQGVSGIAVDQGSTTVENSDTTPTDPTLWQGAIPGTIHLGDLSAGESRVIKYTGRVTTDRCETLTNTARAQAADLPSVSDTAAVIVRCDTPNDNPDLEIKKWVKNNTTGTGYNDSQVDARTGDRVNFKVTVTNSGDATVNNVRMTDRIPSGLEFDDSVSGDGTPSFNGTTFSVDFGSISAGRSKTVEFRAKVLATGSQTICNVAKATGNNVNEVSDDACVKIIVITKPGNPNIELAKRAWNDTKNVDATSVAAARGDYITYTLVTTNTGNADAVNYVISDDLSQVLALADMTDLGGGTLNGNTISYPATTIRPGETIVKQFRVRVKTSLSPNLSFQMRNTYGNTIVINIPGKVVFQAPPTGVAGTSAGVFAGLLTAGFVILLKGRSILKFIAN